MAAGWQWLQYRGGNFPKRKKSAAELCQILCMVTVKIVINSTHVMSMRVTIPCRYCIAFEAMLLVSSCVCLVPSHTRYISHGTYSLFVLKVPLNTGQPTNEPYFECHSLSLVYIIRCGVSSGFRSADTRVKFVCRNAGRPKQ